MMNSIDPTNDNFSEDSPLGLMRKPPPAAVPDGYFANFGERLKERIEEEALQAEAPVLFEMARKSPFIAPKGYFDQFTLNLKARLGTKGGSTIRPMFLSLYATAAAAVIILLIMWKGSMPVSQHYPMLPDMSAVELLAVVDIEEDLIIESLMSEDLTRLEKDIPFPVINPQPKVEETQQNSDLSFDELMDGLEDLDEESLDALEAELLDMEDSDWY